MGSTLKNAKYSFEEIIKCARDSNSLYDIDTHAFNIRCAFEKLEKVSMLLKEKNKLYSELKDLMQARDSAEPSIPFADAAFNTPYWYKKIKKCVILKRKCENCSVFVAVADCGVDCVDVIISNGVLHMFKYDKTNHAWSI